MARECHFCGSNVGNSMDAYGCCNLADALYPSAKPHDEMTVEVRDLVKLHHKVDDLKWQVERRDRAIAYLLKRFGRNRSEH
jgi:hypothetical protein